MSLQSQCQKIYEEAYPEYLWKGMDARALNTLLKQIEKSIEVRQNRKPTEEETLIGFKVILSNPTDWMKKNGCTGMPFFVSQFEQIKQNAKGNNKKNVRGKLEELADAIYKKGSNGKGTITPPK